nr:MATH and LRR domain-containing protein PFE0570w-like [Nomia melanderi]
MLKHTMKETPAKDESLLNEADISETPSSSKIGVDHLTNLSSKISAFISSEDRKLPNFNQPLPVEKSSTRKSKQKPTVVHVQRVKSNSFLSLKPSSKPSKRSLLQKEKASSSIDKKLVLQLEAKRQRMIAKIREISKPNASRVKSQQACILLKNKRNVGSKIRNGRYKCGPRKGVQFSEKQAKERRKQREMNEANNKNDSSNCNNNNVDRNDGNNYADNDNEGDGDSNTTSNNGNSNNGSLRNNNDNQMKCSSTKGVSKTELCNPGYLKKHCQANSNGDTSVTDNVTSTLKPVKRCTVDTTNKLKNIPGNANNIENNIKDDIGVPENQGEHEIHDTTLVEKNVIVERKETIENSDAKCATIVIEENNVHVSEERILNVNKFKNEIAIEGKSISGETKTDSLKNESNSNEENICPSKEYPSRGGKANGILKSKVDQVKRDLFSDEENDQKTSSSSKLPSNEENDISDSIASATSRSLNSENPKGLSRVLQCLQLIPTCKNDHSPIFPEFRRENNHETALNVIIPNSVEYHFHYDDNTLQKKRRRRYSNQELEFQINIVLNDQGCDECVKVMTASNYEEILNLPPKSRKRSGNRKSPVKNENVPESTNKPQIATINLHTKPLAASSPLDKVLTSKVKKATNKIVHETNEKNHDGVSNNKKKTKLDKIPEIAQDNSTAKVFRRKLPEPKESKPIDKRQYTTDPQTLLSNIDLDKFLTSVHGPA